MGIVGIASQAGDRITVVVECPICSVRQNMAISEAAYERWVGGELIQNAFPDMSLADRERLKTGFCDPCWARVFPPDSDDE